MLIGIDASRITRQRRTGTENYSLHVLRAILQQDTAARYRLYFAQDPPAGLLPAQGQLEQRVIRMPRLWTQLGLTGEMLRSPPDVLFVPTHVLPLVHPRRSVVVVYDVGHRAFPRAHGLLEWLYVEWAIRRHVRRATFLITISQATRSDLVRLYGADPSRIAVAYPAVDSAFQPPTPEELRRVRARFGLPERYVLHVGTIKPRKNLPRLVRAFAQAHRPKGTRLVLAGHPGPDLGRLQRTIDDAGVREDVLLLPYLDTADLPALYHGAACVALVSLHEGFGMPALEALACGAPVLASDRGALPEVVGDAAILANPLDVDSIANGLSRVLGDDGLAARLRQAGPPRAASFTWEDAGRVTVETLHRAARVD